MENKVKRVQQKEDLPLVVDLDGTLIKTDLLFETAVLLIKRNIFYVFSIFFWLLIYGRGYLKLQIALRVSLDENILPYDEKLLDFLKNQKNKRQIVLMTGSTIRLANLIASKLKIFTRVYASTDVNLTGKKKAKLLKELYGAGRYDYIGNSTDDILPWKGSRKKMMNNVSNRLVYALNKNGIKPDKIFSKKKNEAFELINSIRLYQWSKNILLFVPFLVGPEQVTFDHFKVILLAFVSFSLLASTIYLANDLLDIENDRNHPVKTNRPIARGSLSIKTALVAIPLFFLLSISLTAFLPVEFLFVMLLYFFITLAYSFNLKAKAMIDVFTLSILYTLRILAGTTLVDAAPSFWLFIFSATLFLSLALMKRYSEILNSKKSNHCVKGRGYNEKDLWSILTIGVASAYSSVLLLALYFSTPEIQSRYEMPYYLWGSKLMFMFWITRIWFLANRKEVDEDPINFALKDKGSLFLISIAAAFFLQASIGYSFE